VTELYQTDSYLSEFDAATAVEGDAVALDRTAFTRAAAVPYDVGSLTAQV
jgi:Ser-tRNA(Ala) deacylase AlaX